MFEATKKRLDEIQHATQRAAPKILRQVRQSLGRTPFVLRVRPEAITIETTARGAKKLDVESLAETLRKEA